MIDAPSTKTFSTRNSEAECQSSKLNAEISKFSVCSNLAPLAGCLDRKWFRAVEYSGWLAVTARLGLSQLKTPFLMGMNFRSEFRCFSDMYFVYETK